MSALHQHVRRRGSRLLAVQQLRLPRACPLSLSHARRDGCAPVVADHAPPFFYQQVCPFCWNKLRENGQSCPGCRNLFTDAPRSAASAAEAEARCVEPNQLGISLLIATASSEPIRPPLPTPCPPFSFKKAKRAAALAPRPAVRRDAAAPTLARAEAVPSQTRPATNDSVQSIDQIRARLAARAREAIERAPEQQQQHLAPSVAVFLAPAALTPAEGKLLATLDKMQRLGLLRAGSTAEALFRQLSRQTSFS